MVCKGDIFVWCKPDTRFAGWEDGQDAASVDCNGVVFIYNIRIDRCNPARFDQQVNYLRCCCHEKRGLCGEGGVLK